MKDQKSGKSIVSAVTALATDIHRRHRTIRIAFLLVAVAALAGVVATMAPAAGYANDDATPAFVTKIPAGFRDWRLISVAHEEGNLHSFAAMLGNDVAIKAFRDGTLPYPDGTIIAALHYGHVASEENDKVFGDPQSFVPGPATNVQFMVKDSKKYAATGGWGFGHFNKDGTPGTNAQLETCFPCHAKASRDFVFTRYAP
jgi:Cytochrome P460